MNHALVRYNTYEHLVESLFTLSFSMLQSNYTKSKKGADTASTFPKGDYKAGRFIDYMSLKNEIFTSKYYRKKVFVESEGIVENRIRQF